MMRLWPSQRGFGRPGRSEGASSTWQGDLGLGEAVFNADFLVNQERLVRNGCANLTRSAWVSGPQSLRVPCLCVEAGVNADAGGTAGGFSSFAGHGQQVAAVRRVSSGPRRLVVLAA